MDIISIISITITIIIRDIQIITFIGIMIIVTIGIMTMT